ncbi:MAG: DinB family protein [Terracidiphilus sp.]
MHKLAQIFDGWNGYQTSLLHAVEPLTSAQLLWRPVPNRRSVGELVRHISLGRITWLSRIATPHIHEIGLRIPQWYVDSDGMRHVVEECIPCDQSDLLVEWLDLSWQPIHELLNEWTVDDLAETYPHRFRGTDYVISRQWTIWRIMCHDIHHGGQLATMLGMQDIEAFELRTLGGHIVEPSRATPTD